MSDVDVLARTIYGEARGEGVSGMQAVASVILNRRAVSLEHPGFWWGDTITEICQKKNQFSCWNENDPNRAKLLAVTTADRVFAAAMREAEDTLAGRHSDRTRGATHYFNPFAVNHPPAWSKKIEPLVIIGHHRFYRPPEVPALHNRKENHD